MQDSARKEGEGNPSPVPEGQSPGGGEEDDVPQFETMFGKTLSAEDTLILRTN